MAVSKAIECGNLRVVFDWRGDRYGHRIQQQFGGEWHTVLESVEGSAADVWPPSPALQSLHVEHRDTGPVALLVGRSGTSHWSASIEPLASRAVVQFDIACRIHGLPGSLGSSYQVASFAHQPIIRVSAPQQQADCQFIEGPELNFWHIRPTADCPAYPCTIRWRYTISVDNSTG
jgi:hypothetical protein